MQPGNSRAGKKWKTIKKHRKVFFNTKAFRDSKVTVFGDRAFGLNYPDAFDDLQGNGGNGIFIHGSNREVKPYSTNGCIVMNNKNLSELDSLITFENTPVIIGERLPYRFNVSDRTKTKLIPLLEQAMLPKKYAGIKSEFNDFYLLGYKKRMVAISNIKILDKKNTNGSSRLYLTEQGDSFVVLIKRKWKEETEVMLAKANKPPPTPVVSEPDRIKSMLESWRKAWENKKLNTYISHYHHGFIGNGKNIAAWKLYKAALNQRYQTISVRISNLKIVVKGNNAKAFFIQNYRSDLFKSLGYKKLELIKTDNTWKIYRERSYPRKPKSWPS